MRVRTFRIACRASIERMKIRIENQFKILYTHTILLDLNIHQTKNIIHVQFTIDIAARESIHGGGRQHVFEHRERPTLIITNQS